jgi:hypothetical protein
MESWMGGACDGELFVGAVEAREEAHSNWYSNRKIYNIPCNPCDSKKVLEICFTSRKHAPMPDTPAIVSSLILRVEEKKRLTCIYSSSEQ